MFKPTLRTTLLGSGAAVAMMAASGPAAAGEIDDLKAQIESLQNKLDSIEARQDAVDTRGPVAPAAAVEAGDKPKTWKLPGTNTSMNIGGYAKLDMIYDLNSFVGDSQTVNAIPLNGSGPGTAAAASDRRNGIFRAHARQSRFWIKTWTPTDWGELATHVEADFEGGGGNQRVSNSSGLRARHLYGRLGPVLAGQTWSNFMDVSALPETIDFAGPAGESFVRQPQLRYTHGFGGSGLSLAVSVENPESTGRPIASLGSGGSGVGGSGVAIDKIPDFTGALKYKHSRGHVALRGVLRQISIDNGGIGTANGALPTTAGGTAFQAVSDSTLGWGLGVSGTYVLGSKDAFGAEFNYGDGIGRYILHGVRNGASCSVAGGGSAGVGTGATVLGNNCTLSTSDLNTQTTWGGYAWWQHKWTDTIRTNTVFGYANIEQDNFIIGSPANFGLPEETLTVHGNIIWSPVSQVNFGLEFIYGRIDRNVNGDNDFSRFQLGMQYKF